MNETNVEYASVEYASVEYMSEGRAFAGFLVAPAAPARRAGILVLHGGAGLGDHERDRARALAALGYVAFAPDLFGETIQSREHGVGMITRLVEDPSVLRGRVGDALARLRGHPGLDGAPAAAIGYCFGGLAALELARSGADVRCVVSFHGGLTTRAPAERGRVRSAILVCTGSRDPFVTREHRAAFEDEMTAADVDWQLHVYGGAMHGFTERRAGRPGCEWHEASDHRSWQAMRALFEEKLESSPHDGGAPALAAPGHGRARVRW